MKTMRVLAAMVAGMAIMMFAPALMAQDAPAPAPAPKSEEKPVEKPKEAEKAPEGEKKEEPPKKEEESQFTKLFKGIEEVTGKVEVTEADIKLFVKHYPEVDKLTETDEKFEKLTDTNLKEAFDYLVKNEKYLAWAKEKGVEAEKFLRLSMRIVTVHMKVGMKDTFKEADKQIEEGAKQIEAMKDQMPADQYKEAMAEMDKARKEMAAMRKTIDALPGPTEAEAKLLEANKEEINKAMDSGSDTKDDEKEDGMGGK